MSSETPSIPHVLKDDEGVVYSPEAFAGVLLRAAVLAIDGGVVFAFAVVALMCDPHLENRQVLHVWIVVSWAYLTILKASPVRSLGLRLTGLRIVTLRGERPSVWRMTFRLMLTIIGPFTIWIDLPWLAADRWKQSLRDKLAGTYVIRNNAMPIGKGTRRTARYGVIGYQFVCWEIRPDSTPV